MQIIKLLLATVCLLWITFAKCQTSQTVASSYVLESECNELILDLEIDAKIEIRKTAASRVSVEMTVQAKVPNDKMLSFLIAQGRYTIETLIDNNKGTIKRSEERRVGKEC